MDHCSGGSSAGGERRETELGEDFVAAAALLAESSVKLIWVKTHEIPQGL